ncbi:protein LURP-one-related 15 [Setaria viridis]|uniref:protein LURP-one-related 15 n=1 Tax=Setaria viridis TaxID=4556 RepID=UPI0014936176|nr:protein LURP-one-related 15-like [Setaria viridis]
MAVTPAPVVGSQFCSPQVLPLRLTTKLTGGCTVTDPAGAVLLRIDVPLFRSCPRRRPPAHPLPAKKGAPGMWQVFRGDRGNGGDLLFTARASPVATPNSGLDVFLAGNTAQNVADFKIKGDFGGSCYFYLGDCHTMVATMNRMSNSLGRPFFGVNVFPHVDSALIAVLVVILHGVNT